MVKVKKLHPDAKLPVRANPSDAGADICSVVYEVIKPGERKVIPTGLAIQLEYKDYPIYVDSFFDSKYFITKHVIESYFRIAPRSGLAAKYGIDTLAGVCDASYCGEIKVVLINTSNEDFVINPGDRIAQLIREVCAIDEFQEVDSLEETTRGANGFGSTGVS